MNLNFIIANFNTIALVIWVIFLGVVVVRFTRPFWVRSIPYSWLVLGAVSLHLLYGIFATWGQYVVWSSNEFTKVFLSSALSKEVPFPSLLEWVRPLFDGANGYFAFYSFQHFFLSTIALLFITGLFVLFFKMYAVYRPSLFGEGDIAVIALAFLIAGWPGAIVLVPLSLALAVFFAILTLLRPSFSNVSLPASFLLATPFALFFAIPILTSLNLYLLLKL